MSLAMDKALMALSLEEEDKPFDMPNLPDFSSAQDNVLSIVGRILNPDYQKIPGLILTMPRKWQKEGRVRGVALSQEKFQFFFQNEHDLNDVLEKGVQTYNEWALVLERWVENPPEEFLQYIPIWVQIRGIPMNHFTKKALTALGDLVGKTKFVAFDPSKPITQDYIRALVLFNVAHPLRKTKVINLPEGGSTVIRYSYEKVQKRCFTCQCLNHEQDKCPITVKKRQEQSAARRANLAAHQDPKGLVLAKGDPLFGVLEEHQVGIDPLSGRPKIAKEVLDEMRNYLRTASNLELSVREERVKSSVKEVEMDPVAQRTVLRLEPAPILITDLNKGKGPVFDYEENQVPRDSFDLNKNPPKLMAASMKASRSHQTRSDPLLIKYSADEESEASFESIFSVPPTVFKPGTSVPGVTGMGKTRTAVRKRPGKTARNAGARKTSSEGKTLEFSQRDGKQQIGNKRRAVEIQEEECITTTQAKCLKVIPHEGSPKSQ
ncbi:uncharacterized protein LOC130508719 [Raphanus sativus]|uniref:Uncharacterized protein LOC130508719 n=1 Tax=Raphanus sativus TaxID=3726 RepID=A0A9W3D905_RAPSA|nr:uncharacterized protein LOC130508719 [Raphanus sativus]